MSKIIFGIDVGGTTCKCGTFSKEGELLRKMVLKLHYYINKEGALYPFPFIKQTIALVCKKLIFFMHLSICQKTIQVFNTICIISLAKSTQIICKTFIIWTIINNSFIIRNFPLV